MVLKKLGLFVRNAHGITLTTSLFCLSSTLWQQLRSLLCACCHVLKTKKNSVPVVNVIPCAFLTILVSACSSLPDKEKEYQLTSEIPPLILPDDISNKDAKTFSNQENGFGRSVELIENNEDVDREESILLDLGEYSDGTALVRIGDVIQRSWRIVGKALSRHSIEITDRDELERIYFVQYDPDFKKIEDGSLWDEFLFIFGSDPANDKKFGVKLVESGDFTEIIVLDSEEEPVSEGPGLKLLHLLYKTIKEDLE